MNWRSIKIALASIAATSILAGCASTAMHEQELREPGANEGIVIGSLLVRGGRDLLGRTEWGLGITRADAKIFAGFEYSLRAQQGRDAVVFAIAMPSGQYRIRQLFQGGFSNFAFNTDFLFEVQPGKTSYIGRVLVEFPDETITIYTPIRIRVEDAKDADVASAEMKYRRKFADVSSRLIMAGSAGSALPGKSTADRALEKDTLTMVMGLDGGASPDCKQRRIANQEIVSADASGAIENWFVDRCGSLVRYAVTYKPNPRGGTNLFVKPGEVVGKAEGK